jgi:hypothetical protein
LENDKAFTSLFEDDQAVLSNEDLARILDARVSVPDQARVAVLEFGADRGEDWWSAELADIREQGIRRLLEKVESSERVASAAALPAMLAPRVRSVPQLRLAAARFQADEILLYQDRIRTYHRSRLWASDEVKASCIVEAVLLDVRSGLVLFSTTASRDFSARETRDDFGFSETLSRARAAALSAALDQVGDELLGFLRRDRRLSELSILVPNFSQRKSVSWYRKGQRADDAGSGVLVHPCGQRRAGLGQRRLHIPQADASAQAV